MGRGKNRFLSYLEENFYDRIYNSIKSYVIRHREGLIIEPKDLIAVENIDVENLGLMSAWIDSKDNSRIEFDLHVNPDISYVEVSGRHRDREASGTRLWLTLSCKAKVEDGIKGFFITNVDLFNKDTKQTKPLDEYMVPCISRSEYEKYANEILNKYYPEAAKGDGPIDPRIIARRMGFTIIERSIRKDRSIFGQIYFDECTTTLFNNEKDNDEKITIPANTIIIDPDANDKYSYGSESITIAHECVHYELHKKAYLFAKFINNGNISCISCMNGGKVDGIAETDVNESFMEAQANGIAPSLVMPEESFKKRAEELYKEYSSSTQDPIEFIDRMISDLRNEYRVTIPAVKKRLRELGYLRNVSVFEWDKTNKKYIDAYAYQAGSLSNDETFSITFDDYQKALDNPNSQLLAVMFNKDFIFVSNHIVFNDEKYIIKDDNDDYVLTEYAKRHLDECALKFKIKNNITLLSKKSIGTFCYLCKGIADDMSFDLLVQQDSKVLLNPNIKDLRLRHENAQKQVIRIIEDSENC